MGSRFEKFSERARRVLSLAQEEAQRFNHNYIGTEHILLGLQPNSRLEQGAFSGRVHHWSGREAAPG